MSEAETAAASPPLPWLAFGVVIGALEPAALSTIFPHGPSPTLWWWIAGLPMAVVAAIAYRRPFLRNWLLFASALTLGMAWRAPCLVEKSGSNEPRLIDVAGTAGGIGWQSFKQGFQLQPTQAHDAGDFRPPPRLWVVGPGLPAVESGDWVRVRGTLQRDLRGDRIDAVDVRVITPRERGARGWAWRAIDRLGGHRELAGALLLGQGTPPEKQLFRAAGLLHILAVSGMHFVIAAALAGWLLRLFGAPWLARMIALSVLMLGYLWLTGANAATQRAAAMSLAFCAAALLAREPHRLAAVSLAALALVVIHPNTVADHGFQLSLAAVLGIVTLGTDLMHLRQSRWSLMPWPLDRPAWRVALFAARSVCDGFCIGVAACLATAPLVAWHYGAANLWSPLSSLIVSPPTTLALWLGLPFLFLAGIWRSGPWQGLSSALDWSLDAVVATVSFSARLPGASLPVPPPSPVLLLAWPLLFVPLRDASSLVLRVMAAALLLLAW